MASVIKRIDITEFTDNVYETIYFCRNCDPNGKGGNGGIIYREDSDSKSNIDHIKRFHKFCPTCGDKIDWDNITERKNMLR